MNNKILLFVVAASLGCVNAWQAMFMKGRMEIRTLKNQ